MKKFNFKDAFIAVIVVFVALVAALWSWNTISELFGGPHAQFKHAVAVMSLLVIAKWFATTKWKNHCHNIRCTDDATHKIA